MPRPARTAVVASACAALAACTAREPAAERSGHRLIGDEPRRMLADDGLARWLESDAFDVSRDGSRWRVVGGAPEPRPGGLGVGPGTVWIEMDLGCDAREADALELSISGTPAATAHLHWTSQERGWHPEQSLEAHVGEAEARERRVRFDLRSHPAWSGPVAQLRLGIRPQSDATSLLVEQVSVRRMALDAARVDEATGSSFKVDWRHEDVREAVLLGGGRAWEAPVRVPAGASLRFGAALVPGGAPAALRIVAVPENGAPAAAIADQLPVDRDWRDVSLPMPPLHGRPARLRFECAAPAGASSRSTAAWIANPEVVADVPGAPRRPSVVLISIDTLRADRLSILGAERPTSPHIDRWARSRAVRFTQAVSQAPWTLPSHVSLFSGRDAARHGINHGTARVPRSLPMLASRFRDAGYATAAVTGGGAVSPGYGIDQGFERYDHYAGAGRDEDLAWSLPRALRWLEANADRPFFLFFHTYEVHDPYRERPAYARLGGKPLPAADAATPIGLHLAPPGPADGYGFGAGHELRWRGGPRDGEPLLPDEIPVVRDRYDSEIAHVDGEIRKILDLLDRRGIADRTAVAIVSDHGEALGEDGVAGHGYLLESNLRVPILLSLPDGRGAGRAVDAQVRLMDLAPTLLEAAGLRPLQGIEGRSLVPLIDGAETASRDAFTYAASMNRGMSLRVGASALAIFDNTAWRERLGSSALRRPGPPRPGAEAEDALLPALRRRIVAELEAGLAGMRVILRNGSAAPFRGTIAHPAIDPTTVKATDTGCACVTFLPPHGVAFDVPPGSRHEIVLEVPARGELRITAGTPGDVPAVIALPLSAAGHRHASWIPDRLTAGEGALPPGATGIELSCRGMAPDLDRDPASDADLRERLRALGYLP